MQWFYRELGRLEAGAEPVVTATVVAVTGATPRGVGAKMLVRRDGAIDGSVGGGCGEAEVRGHAIRVFDERRSALMQLDLTGELSDDSATNCGGVMEVFLERLAWDENPGLGVSPSHLLVAVDRAAAARQPLALVVVIEARDGMAALAPGTKWLVTPGGEIVGELPDTPGIAGWLREEAEAALAAGRGRRVSATRRAGRWDRAADGEIGLFVEPILLTPELVVVGAGHIAVPLVTMAKLLDFHVTVLDDRAAFANRQRFPQADTVLVGAVDAELRRRPISPDTYVVLVTRDHQHDEAALKVVAASPAAYVGMIGSRRRIREVFRHVAEAGVPASAIARVHAPIGLPIGAESPAEIAAAIAAELVQVRRASRAGASSVVTGGSRAG